jgi:rhodanese-related sulfurtransferase
MVATISPTTLADLRRKGEKVTLIDVRTPAEYGEVHVDLAHNIPLDRLDAQTVAAVAGHGPVYFVCKSGNRSQKACEKLLAEGIDHVVSVEGGTAACEAAGVPVVRGKKAMSLERQVRIAAGAMVAIGAALAAFGPEAPVNWQAIGAGLAGFVGCGLVFAGITDTCGMAMLIAKMPWNQVSGGSCSTVTTCSRAILLGLLLNAGLPPVSLLERGVPPQVLAEILSKDKSISSSGLTRVRCAEATPLPKPLGDDVGAIKPGHLQLVEAGLSAVVGK